jgi:archaemetzincin
MMFLNCFILSLAMVFVSCESERSLDVSDDDLVQKLKTVDVPLEQPKIGDWLYAHDEKGQTLNQYQMSKPVRPDSTHFRIYLLPLGTFTPWQDSVISATASYLAVFFDLDTRVLPRMDDTILPSDNIRVFVDGSEQLLTTDILNYLNKSKPDDGLVVMAITSKDLYAGPEFNFVFGQARAKHRVAVSSMFRYSEDVNDSAHYSILLGRLIKTSSHEVAHMFGCQHCVNAACLMNGSNSLAESDSRPNRLCSECHRKLRWNLKFDVPERLKKLSVFFKKNKLNHDFTLAEGDIIVLQD